MFIVEVMILLLQVAIFVFLERSRRGLQQKHEELAEVLPDLPMTFNDYANLMRPTAVYPNRGANLHYVGLGCTEEAGEIAGKIKKLERDHGITCLADIQLALHVSLPELQLAATDPIKASKARDDIEFLYNGIKKEIGDNLWYLDAAAFECGWTLEECARCNVDKILDRQRRGTLNGSGDNR